MMQDQVSQKVRDQLHCLVTALHVHSVIAGMSEPKPPMWWHTLTTTDAIVSFQLGGGR